MTARVVNLLFCGLLVTLFMFCTKAEEPVQEGNGIYRLDVTVAGSGAVTFGDRKCAKVCSIRLNRDEEVTLDAVPATEWRFVEWLGACSGTGTCILTMTEDKSVTAVFTYP